MATAFKLNERSFKAAGPNIKQCLYVVLDEKEAVLLQLAIPAVELHLVLGVERRVVAAGRPGAIARLVAVLAVIVLARPVIRFLLVRLQRHHAREDGVARPAADAFHHRAKNWQMAL